MNSCDLAGDSLMRSLLFLLLVLMAAATRVHALTCQELNGAQVFSREEPPTYLGFFGSPYAADSIANIDGTYGSQYSVLSVHDTLGNYGSPYSPYSVNNPYANTPPVIMSGGSIIALLTANAYLPGGIALQTIEASCYFSATTPGGGAPPPIEPVNLDQHGITGTWANPDFPGQGVVVDVVPDQSVPGQGLLFAGWYTYDVTAAGGQRWYSLQATVSSVRPSTAFAIFQTVGGAFGSGQSPTTTEVGQAELMLVDCNHALLAYRFRDGSDRNDVMPLVRILPNMTCAVGGDTGAPSGAYVLSGTWADLGDAGQGLVVEVNPGLGFMFAGWYTYARDASASAGASGQRWYTLQATIGSNPTIFDSVGIYETTGGAFGGTDPVTTRQVGSAQLQFLSCSTATLTYTFTTGENAGQSGVLNLSRVMPVPAGCQ
jgi:hypothetical protein